MATFRFDYTCPIIDEAIKRTKSYLEDFAYEIIDKTKNNETIDLDSEINNVLSYITSYYEDVRSTNKAMRDEAERQISELDEIIKDYELEIRRLESEIDNLKNA